jgi:hypothetical protein
MRVMLARHSRPVDQDQYSEARDLLRSRIGIQRSRRTIFLLPAAAAPAPRARGAPKWTRRAWLC